MRPTFQVLVVVVAVFGAGLGVAFAGGTMYGRTSADNGSPSATPSAAQGSGGLSSGGALPAGAQVPTVGVIEQIDGSTVTVRTQAGGTVTVKLQPETQLTQSAAATAADLKPGTSVVVSGSVGTDGAVEARSVQIGGGLVQIGGAGQGAGGARQGNASGTPPAGTAPAGATQGASPGDGATPGTPPAGAQPAGTATRP